jgi:ATP synthase F1 gamma subunit
MRKLNDITREYEATATIVELTRAFEGISSMRISKIKDQVQRSEAYFAELWKIYTQLRVDELFHFGRSQSVEKVIDKELLIMITSEGSFSGDIDERLITQALGHYQPERNDIIVIGHHGAAQLIQRGVRYIRNFKLPAKDTNINVTPLTLEVQKYASTIVFYPGYISLMTQDIRNIKLSNAVAERGRGVTQGEEIISEQNYIFEPSTYAVVDHLERSMMQVALSEVILESKLAQYASRFKAMNAAHHKADESLSSLKLVHSRTRRDIKDERTREIMNGLRRATA